MSRCDMDKAVKLLNETYQKALDTPMILKPMSFALYQTWKHMDKIEKARKLKKE